MPTHTATQKDDPLAPARLRGLQARLRMLESGGGSLSAEQVAHMLALTRQGVDKRRQAGRLLGLALGRRAYAYPAWQFQDGRTVPGLEASLTALADHDPWTRLTLFLNPHAWLDDQTPATALARGRIEDVLAAAKAYGEQGAL